MNEPFLRLGPLSSYTEVLDVPNRTGGVTKNQVYPEGSLLAYPEGSHFFDPEGSSFFVRTRRGPIFTNPEEFLFCRSGGVLICQSGRVLIWQSGRVFFAYPEGSQSRRVIYPIQKGQLFSVLTRSGPIL